MKTYTVEQIKNYLAKCDSLGDAAYFCTEENIDKANEPEEPGDGEDTDEDLNTRI